MKAVALSNFPLTNLTCAALIIFFVLFSAMCIWVFQKFNQDKYLHLSQLPLEDS